MSALLCLPARTNYYTTACDETDFRLPLLSFFSFVLPLFLFFHEKETVTLVNNFFRRLRFREKELLIYLENERISVPIAANFIGLT